MDTSHIKRGLHFSCTRCSNCCRHTPGYVFLSKKDITNLLSATGLPRSEFLRKYCRIVSVNGFYRLSLREKQNYDCIFWADNACQVYKKRPLQCQSYPFWSSIISSDSSWQEQKRMCPGIDKGVFHPKRKIEYWLKRRLKERFIELLPHHVAPYIDDVEKIQSHG